jgi:hypothetical protein
LMSSACYTADFKDAIHRKNLNVFARIGGSGVTCETKKL